MQWSVWWVHSFSRFRAFVKQVRLAGSWTWGRVIRGLVVAGGLLILFFWLFWKPSCYGFLFGDCWRSLAILLEGHLGIFGDILYILPNFLSRSKLGLSAFAMGCIYHSLQSVPVRDTATLICKIRIDGSPGKRDVWCNWKLMGKLDVHVFTLHACGRIGTFML